MTSTERLTQLFNNEYPPGRTSPYEISSLANISSPDEKTSLGAVWLLGIVDAVRESLGYLFDDNGDVETDAVNSVADSMVPTHTYDTWKIFLDLAGWAEEHPKGSGQWPEGDPTQNANLVLYGMVESIINAMVDNMSETLRGEDRKDSAANVINGIDTDTIASLMESTTPRTVASQRDWIRLVSVYHLLTGYLVRRKDPARVTEAVTVYDLDDFDSTMFDQCDAIGKFLTETENVTNMDELATIHRDYVIRVSHTGWCAAGTYGYLNTCWDEYAPAWLTAGRPFPADDDEVGHSPLLWVWHDSATGKGIRGWSHGDHCICGHECTQACVKVGNIPLDGSSRLCFRCEQYVAYVGPPITLTTPGYAFGVEKVGSVDRDWVRVVGREGEKPDHRHHA